MGEPRRGRLAVYLGAMPGVGKTSAMLTEGLRLAESGTDVVVALVDSHGRAFTEDRAKGLERVPLMQVGYRNSRFDELDVETLTGVAQHETVPDRVVSAAERVELVDVDPETLRARLSEGDVLGSGAVTESALAGYYRADKLSALRDLALGWLADHDVSSQWSERPSNPVGVVAALTGAPEGRHVVRRAAQMANDVGGELIGLHVREPSGLVDSHPDWLDEQRRLLAELGGRYMEVDAVDVAQAVLDVCRSEHVGHLVLGRSRRTRRDEMLHGSVIARALRGAGCVEVHVVPSQQQPSGLNPTRTRLTRRGRVPLPRRRRQLAWGLAFVAPVLCTVALLPARSSVGIAGALFAALLGVVVAAAIGGVGPAAVAVVAGFLTADFFFTRPYYSLRVDHAIDVIALVAFAVVGGAVGVLVDILSRQGVQVAGARTESEGLARLAAETLGATPGALPLVAQTLRSTFGLEAVAVLHRVGGEWRPEFVLGEPIPRRPEDAELNAELSGGRVLVLVANDAPGRNLQLLRSFVNALRLCREREQLVQLTHTHELG